MTGSPAIVLAEKIEQLRSSVTSRSRPCEPSTDSKVEPEPKKQAVWTPPEAETTNWPDIHWLLVKNVLATFAVKLQPNAPAQQAEAVLPQPPRIAEQPPDAVLPQPPAITDSAAVAELPLPPPTKALPPEAELLYPPDTVLTSPVDALPRPPPIVV